MPRSAYVRPTMPLPDLGAGGATAGLQVSAQPVDQPANVRPDNSDLQLAQSLAAFHAPVKDFLDRAAQQQAQQDSKDAATAGAAEGARRGETDTDPMSALQSPSAAPSWVPPAFASDFQEGYRKSVGMATGARSANEMLAQYEAQKNSEGFNAESFLNDFSSKEFQGINDPLVLASASPHFAQAASAIRTNFAQVQQQKLKDIQTGQVQTNLDAMVRPDLSPELNAQAFNDIAAPLLKQGTFTRPELGEMYVDHLNTISEKNGGMPELFEGARVLDSSGMSPERSSPALEAKIEKYQLEATRMRDQKIADKNLYLNSMTLAGWGDDLKSGNFDNVSDDKLAQHIGPGDVFSSKDAYEAFREKRDAAKAYYDQLHAADGAVQAGTASALDPKVAKAAGDRTANAPEGGMTLIHASLGQPGPDANAKFQAGLQQLVDIAQGGKFNYVNDEVKQGFNSMNTRVLKDGDAPPADFLQAANARAMLLKQNPTLANAYFDKPAQQLFDSFNDARKDATGVDTSGAVANPTEAYHQAYQTLDPANAIRVADMRKSDPMFDAKIAKAVAGVTTGGFPLPNILRAQWMGTYPTNNDAMTAWAQPHVKDMLTREPGLSLSDALTRIQNKASAEWTYVPALNANVNVGTGFDKDIASQALDKWATLQKGIYGKDSQFFVHMDNAGMLKWSEATTGHSGTIPLQQVVQNYTTEKYAAKPAPSSSQVAGSLQAGDLAGAPPQAYSPITPQSSTNNNANISNLDTVPVKPTQLGDKNGLAADFMQRGDPTAALITMREGVALTAYQDPAKGAGANIAMGYNQKANADHWQDDFRKAGIPQGTWDSVWAGKQAITPDQAQRLTMQVYPRYAAKAQAAFDAGTPGAWAKLPANQQAVLTDMAWQVGDISKFPKAIAAFKAGDIAEATKQITTTYVNPTGKRVADTGGLALRSNMLAGIGPFQTLQQHVAQYPSSAFDGMKQALNQQ